MNPSQEDDDFEYDTSDGVAPPPLFGTGAADLVNEALADDVFHGSFPVRATMMLRTPLDDLLHLADAAPEMLRDLLAGRRRDDPCWAEFVARRPAFAGVAPLECVPSRDLAKLFAVRPELADRRNTNRLSGADWAFLLRRRPELDSLRSWGAMSGAEWVALLCGSSRSRNVLLDEIDEPGRDAPRPEFADRCRWDLLSGTDWATALGEHPEWASFCNKATCGDGRNGWDRFRGADWAALLAARPQFSSVADWDSLTGPDWAALLRAKPEFADRCDWGRLGGRDWAALLRDRPEFADRCRVWEKIGGADAADLAAARPELADRIVWRNLSGRDWHVLLGSHPEFWDRKPADVAVDHTAPRPRIWAPAEGRRHRRPWKIVSGGQTGVDRAGLVAAMELGLPTGGWVPCGRLAEDGVVPAMFSTLRECPTGGFRERTRANVIDSDATLILVDALPLVGGTGYTAEYAAKNGRPCKAFLLSDEDAAAQIRDWMLSLEVSVRPGADGSIVLNVAGPRESGAPGIFERAKKRLLEAFAGFRPVETGADKR